MSRSDVARGPCRCPSGIRCDTTAECFVLGFVQVPDLERVAQLRDARCGRIEQVVRFWGDTNGL